MSTNTDVILYKVNELGDDEWKELAGEVSKDTFRSILDKLIKATGVQDLRPGSTKP